MRSVIFTLLLLGSSLSNLLFAQAGYYGRKTVIEFGALGRNPLIANMEYRNDHYFKTFKNENGKLVNKNNTFDYGYSAGVHFLSNRMASFGLYGSIYKTNSPGLIGQGMTAQGDYMSIIAMEQFSYTTYSLIPTLSLSSNELIKPVGLSSEIGLGITSAKLNQKDYLYSTDAFYKDIVDSLYQNGTLYDKKAKYSAAVLMYGLKVRQPITKRLLIYYGLRYTLHLGFKNDRNIMGTDNHPYNATSYYVTHALRRNYVNFQIGLCFML